MSRGNNRRHSRHFGPTPGIRPAGSPRDPASLDDVMSGYEIEEPAAVSGTGTPAPQSDRPQAGPNLPPQRPQGQPQRPANPQGQGQRPVNPRTVPLVRREHPALRVRVRAPRIRRASLAVTASPRAISATPHVETDNPAKDNPAKDNLAMSRLGMASDANLGRRSHRGILSAPTASSPNPSPRPREARRSRSSARRQFPVHPVMPSGRPIDSRSASPNVRCAIGTGRSRPRRPTRM
jgi:hypothetical protein